MKSFKYPIKFLSLVKIPITIGIFLGMPLNTQSLFAEEKSACSRAPSPGTKIIVTGPDSWKSLVTVWEPKDNDKFLTEKIGLLKLKAAEEFLDYLGEVSTKLEIKQVQNNKGELIKQSYTHERNIDWNGIKPILMSMKSFHCYDKDRIFVSGGWTSDSLKNANALIDLKKAQEELFNLEMVLEANSMFYDKKIKKKFPKLYETDDPEYIRNAITYIKKVRGLKLK